MADNMDPVTTQPGADADTLALLDKSAPVSPAVVQDSNTAPDDDASAGKPGRPRKEGVERTPSGRIRRKRGRRASTSSRTPTTGRFTRDDAAAALSPAAATDAPLTGEVKTGTPPVPTPTIDPQALAFTTVVAKVAFTGLAALGARIMKNANYKPTDDETKMISEAGALWYLSMNPNGALDSPGWVLLGALGMYYLRASGQLEAIVATIVQQQAATPDAPGANAAG